MEIPGTDKYLIYQRQRISQVVTRIAEFVDQLQAAPGDDAARLGLCERLASQQRYGEEIVIVLHYMITSGDSGNIQVVNNDILNFLLDHMKLTYAFWTMNKPENHSKGYDEQLVRLINF